MVDNNTVTCPYCYIYIDNRRIQKHLLKCEKQHGRDKDYKVCPYNATHILPEHELKEHLLLCPDSATVDKVINYERSKQFGEIPKLKGFTSVPEYNSFQIPSTENWSNESSPEVVSRIQTPFSFSSKNDPTTINIDRHSGQREEKFKMKTDIPSELYLSKAPRDPKTKSKTSSQIFQYSLTKVSERKNTVKGEQSSVGEAVIHNQSPDASCLHDLKIKTDHVIQTGNISSCVSNHKSEDYHLRQCMETSIDPSINSIKEIPVEAERKITNSFASNSLSACVSPTEKPRVVGTGRGILRNFQQNNNPMACNNILTEKCQLSATRLRHSLPSNSGEQVLRSESLPTTYDDHQKATIIPDSQNKLLLRFRQLTSGEAHIQSSASTGRGRLLQHLAKLVSKKDTDDKPTLLKEATIEQQTQTVGEMRGIHVPMIKDVNQPAVSLGRGARLLNGNQDPILFPPNRSLYSNMDEAYFTDSSISSNECFEDAKKATEFNN